MDQTHWIPVQRRQPLSTFYYHDHFTEMLAFVERHYAHVLDTDHRDFLQRFRSVSTPAQCLYVRLVNRKGRVFARNKLRYPELGDSRPLLDELAAGRLIAQPTATQFDDVLSFLTRAEILTVLMPRIAGLPRASKKAELIAIASQHVEPADFLAALQTERLFIQRGVEPLGFLTFLYFGRVQSGLESFTLRDLGLVRADHSDADYEARFAEADEAHESYYFARRLQTAGEVSGVDLEKLVAESVDWPEPGFQGSARLRDALALQLGKCLAASGDLLAAIELYRRGESADCREREVRVLLGLKRTDEARTILERCMAAPQSEEERLFATDLYSRKFCRKRTSQLTDTLREAEILKLDESQRGRPERAAIDWFEDQGSQAWRSENLLWRSLFGLLFWEELFGNAAAARHSPFDSLPAALASRQFSSDFRAAIDCKLDLLENFSALQQQLLKTSTRHYGQRNAVFRWRENMIEPMLILARHAPAAGLRQMLQRLCDDYPEHRYGYPDLMVLTAGQLRFIEIKSEGDQLRRKQLLRLQQLRAAGFNADVVRVDWTLDPRQVYVVVDVETTGGRGDQHRVTEIGAVKVQAGKLVDRFQTLLNPQRGIPGNITRLTGITPAMVADAPYFSDIADGFEEFLGDSIFVAHNVNFDYGFIAREFKRIGRVFRRPRLCTCASMRKLYPGHRSYSLAILAREYDIPLKSHHRAPCDAEAAAELLLLINEKREAGQFG